MAAQLGVAERLQQQAGFHTFLLGTEERGVGLALDWGYGYYANVDMHGNLRLREEWARQHGILLLLSKDQQWTWDPVTDTITLLQDGGSIDPDYAANSKRLLTILRFATATA